MASFPIENIPFEDKQYAEWVSPDENVQALALHLRLAVRAGYTALHITENALEPSLETVLKAECEDAIDVETLQALKKQEMLALSYENLPFQRIGSYLQLSYIATAEMRFVEQVQRLSQEQPAVLDEYVDPQLNHLQLEAVRLALGQQAVIIAGGPGTGKTYTVGRFLQAYASTQDERFVRVVLTAPTGKAAVQLEKSLLHAFQGAIPFSYDVKTIHNLVRKGVLIDAHVLIVDECSMIDTHMFAELLRLVPRGTKLLLVGDPDQLPPIGVGSPFAALVYAEHAPFPRVLLQSVKRTSEEALSALATSLREGDREFFFSLESHREKEDGALSWYPLTEEMVEKRMALGAVPLILTPQRFGLFGLNRLNEKAAALFDEVPLIVTKNDWTLKVTNGELGFKVQRALFGQLRDYFKSGEKEIPLSLLPAYETAYALSIHKSQGSEADRVLVLLPEGAELFGWKLLYTACTRAKKRLEIFASLNTLEKTFENRQESYQTIQQKLAESVKCSLS